MKRTAEPEGRRWRITTTGGEQPLWAADGKALFFQSRDNKIMAAAFRASEASIEVTSIHPLFAAPAFMAGYDISPDGKRFVIGRAYEPLPSSPLTMVQNWDADLRKK